MSEILKWCRVTALGALLLAGCSGSENSGTASSTAVTGVFVDGPASGIKYVFGRYSGLTGPGGTYTCQPGQTGQFKLGNINIGESVCTSVTTPIELVKNRAPHLTADQAQADALPLVQFLMSVGTVAGDGSISIPDSVIARAANQSANLQTANFATLQSIAQTITGNPSLAYVDAATASIHLNNSLTNLDLFKHAGEYVSSSWHNDTAAHFLVKPNGEITGYLLVAYNYVHEMTGSVSPSGDFWISLKGPPLTVASTISTGISNGAGTLTGTTNAGPYETFQYVLQRVTTATNKYYGVFTGTLTNANGSPASWWFAIDANGKVFGFESGANLGTMTYQMGLTGEIDMSTGTITLTNMPWYRDNITLTCTIGADGAVNNGTWQGGSYSGTFTGAKLPIH